VRFGIISDIHANLNALEATLDALEDHNVDQIICLGDVVGYNANPNECVELLRVRAIPTILGNHDAVACGLDEPYGFNPIALATVLWTREQLSEENRNWLRALPSVLEFPEFIAVHGAPPEDHNTYLFSWEDVIPYLGFLREKGKSLCFFGHTHSPGIFSADGMYSLDEESKFYLNHSKIFFINPGSVGQPRDGNPQAACGIYDSEENSYQQLRINYPVEEAAAHVLEAGLPRFLAERLLLGR
jgi:predicted phosphodiesterase